MWESSPIGAFVDVMWAEADGWRTLFVTNDAVAAFVTSIYHFDAVEIDATLQVHRDRQRLAASWASATLEWTLGRAVPFPPRSSWVARRVERPIARVAMGVEIMGVSPTGVAERYEAHRLRRIIGGWAVVGGHDLGAIGPPTPACGFGFSEPPPFASITEVTTHVSDPDGVIVFR
ncbi:MAG: hypothetical protein O3C27_17125 [Actinomycetota bacterium]|nr:hypothetical protein [Actinomycetota bacterium]